MKKTPTITVSAFDNAVQVREVCAALGKMDWPTRSGHTPIVGFAVDGKTAVDLQPTSKRKVGTVDELGTAMGRIVGPAKASLHFDCSTTQKLAVQGKCPRVRDAVERLLDAIDIEKLHSIQFNGSPEASDLQFIRDTAPQVEIVFVLGREIIEEGRNAIADALKTFAPVGYVLIDPSGGRGEEIDTRRASELIELIHEHAPEAGISAAGGVSVDNFGRIYNALTECNNDNPVSMDTESRVRNAETDRLVPAKAIAFFEKAIQVVSAQKLD